jgi:hypothetical protein
VEPEGPWAGFAAQGVHDWIEVLGELLDPADDPTAVLATLRGALLDLLATGDERRTTAAVRRCTAALADERHVRRDLADERAARRKGGARF